VKLADIIQGLCDHRDELKVDLKTFRDHRSTAQERIVETQMEINETTFLIDRLSELEEE
jgi:hypothetical protein